MISRLCRIHNSLILYNQLSIDSDEFTRGALPSEHGFAHGVAAVTFHRGAHTAGTEAGLDALRHEQFQNSLAYGQVMALGGEQLELLVEHDAGDLLLGVVAQAVEDAAHVETREHFRA